MKTEIVTSEANEVLRLLRSLPPRERLRVVAEVLPELEDELPVTAESAGFWQGSEMEALAQRQGIRPIVELEALLGGWPEDESVDDFLAMLERCRQENPAEVRPV